MDINLITDINSLTEQNDYSKLDIVDIIAKQKSDSVTGPVYEFVQKNNKPTYHNLKTTSTKIETNLTLLEIALYKSKWCTDKTCTER